MNLLLEYLSFACTGTGQATFYNTKQEQEAALSRLHTAALAENRRIYALSALLPVNDRSKQIVLLNLLIAGRQRQDAELEWQLIQAIAQILPFNRILNLFLEIQQLGVNNARTRRLGKWLWNRYGDTFRVIKYRAKFRALLRHCHIPEGSNPAKAELHRWVFGKVSQAAQVQHNPLLAARLAAVQDYEAVFALPFDIARDLAVCQHQRKAAEFTQEFALRGKLTRKEQLRAQGTAGVEVDYRKFSLLELLRHLYQHPIEWDLIAPVLDEKAQQLAEPLRLPPKVALVVDNSQSAIGSQERLYYPLAVIEAIARLCLAVKNSDVQAFYVGAPMDCSWLKAQGGTELRQPLAQALAWRPDLVLILSDGYENTSAGSVVQLLNARAVKNSGIAIIHLNPVAAAETGGVRRLADNVPTFGLSQPEQFPLVALLGQAYTQPAVLEAFFNRIEKALKEGDYHAARLTAGLSSHITTDSGKHDAGALSGAED
jgi:hypothetical protein